MNNVMTDYSSLWRDRCEQKLDELLPSALQAPARLHQAMRYACLGGGKRLRAQLVYATGELLNCPIDALDHAAAAVEMIHAYSLIHDDLPAMDNDDLRRGKATVHIAFDQATAILAGDALQACAYATLLNTDCTALLKIQLLDTLIRASGSEGMCGGQQLDIDASKQHISFIKLQTLHAMKTGALIVASVQMAAIIGQANADTFDALRVFAKDLGLAFQIQDDILDVESTTETLGKSAGKDIAQEKSTYPALLGLQESKQLLETMLQRMREILLPFGERAKPLLALAEFAVNRRN
ncbi:MAG: polyprenyl synthetase family protein [Arenimonas sp.]|nr:polyprenyl synthetase family protein [Arenimonas sp.]